jgi:UDP-N-acetylmuramoylalanine--D-glutamate ligase
MLELAGQKVLVLGLGVSGRSAAAFCAERGAAVVAADERPSEALGALDLPPAVAVTCGSPFPDPADFDLVVPSPGVPPARYAGRARRAWGDVELAARALAVPVVAVTGTNGKSTVTLLLEAMLRATGLRAEAAGNLGRPALGLVGRPLDAAVLEVSSFQLETTESFHPRVAVILNLAPDHLDRHGSFEAYVEAKARILAHQTGADAAVLNRDDPAVWALRERAIGRVFGFARSGPLARGAWSDASAAWVRDEGDPQRVALEGDWRGAELENALAALAAVVALGSDPQRAAGALAGFERPPHRCEVVSRAEGVTWVNDSKATNVGAAVRALDHFAAPVIWIAGGRDKGLDFAPLAAVAKGRARVALLLGEAAPALGRALHGRVACEQVSDLEAAVARARQLAQPGDVVLLSPACASFDQFASFEERGERFRAAVLTGAPR